jgi:hypothetical protein
VVNICRRSTLALKSEVESVALEQVDPLMETIWHSWAEADELKVRAPSPVLASHGVGVGEDPQLNEAVWLATALVQIVSHCDEVSVAVMMFDVVSTPPEAVMRSLSDT